MDNLNCPVAVQASRQGDRIALELGNQLFSYQQLDRLVNAAAKEVQIQGVQTGHVIATVVGNSIELLILAIVCWRSGYIWAPFNPLWPLADTERQLALLKPHWLWSTNDLLSKQYSFLKVPTVAYLTSQAVVVGKTDSPDSELPVDLLQTSGTSGNAKFVAHNLRNHLLNARASSDIIPVTDSDAWLLSLPLHHIAGVAILYRCFEAGARVVLTDSNEHWLTPVFAGRVTHLSLVNTQLFDLLATRESVPGRLKKILLGGGAISPELLKQAKDRGLHCFSSYGMTEASSQIYTIDHGPRTCAQQHSADITKLQVAHLATRERLLNCVRVRLDDQQQILIKGDSLALGYWQNGRICSFLDENDWFATGDTGQFCDARLRITGRRDNVFVCNGENLQPEQIELALLRHPAVRRVLVVPVDVLRSGKVPVAFVDWKESPGEPFNNWLTANVQGLQRPRAVLAWHYVIAKNNKFDRKASALVAQQLVSELAEL